MTQLYVGNLTYSTTEPELRSMFEKYGRVALIRIATDSSTGRSRGFAFVSMPLMEDAEEAIVSLNGSRHSGRTLVVNESRGVDQPGKRAARLSAIARLNLI
jgi:RNA recognition motif-containing protein